MPKIKTHSGAKKRFKLTKNGLVKMGHTNRRHILTKKSTKAQERPACWRICRRYQRSCCKEPYSV